MAKKGILVGDFSEEDIDNKRDQEEVGRKAAETGLKYTNRQILKKGGKMFMRIWVCSFADCEDFQ